jgi:hypothetical protein
MLPETMRAARQRKAIREQLDELVRRNVENLPWSILQSVNDAFWKYESVLQDRMKGALEATQGAVEAAIASRISQSENTVGERGRLQQILAGLEEVRSSLSGPGTMLDRRAASDSPS